MLGWEQHMSQETNRSVLNFSFYPIICKTDICISYLRLTHNCAQPRLLGGGGLQGLGDSKREGLE